MKGYIHSFESFGTVDGPGIRFVVFMQGCPLKCKYCHNRDTWEVGIGKQYEVEEVAKKVLRSRPFMNSSGGGITVSGGEPLLQSEFLLELFQFLKENGVHTAIDTAGSLPVNDKIQKLLEVTDLVILDIKHIDNEKCMELTGQSNKNELDFARYCSEHNIPMWIRQVLVPGYTDDESDLKKTREFIDSLKTVEKIEVLPYHDLGKTKWENMGLVYPLEGVKTPTNETIKRAEEILIEANKKQGI